MATCIDYVKVPVTNEYLNNNVNNVTIHLKYFDFFTSKSRLLQRKAK